MSLGDAVDGLDMSPVKTPLSQNRSTLDICRETRERPLQEHLTADSKERNFGDGGGLGRHQAHGNRRADVEGERCCPTCHLGVKRHEFEFEVN